MILLITDRFASDLLVSNIYERAVHSRLVDFLNAINLFYYERYGFR